mgnify:CR=1 FL=1
MPKVVSTSVNADGGPHFEILSNAGFEIEPVDRSVDELSRRYLARSHEFRKRHGVVFFVVLH